MQYFINRVIIFYGLKIWKIHWKKFDMLIQFLFQNKFVNISKKAPIQDWIYWNKIIMYFIVRNDVPIYLEQFMAYRIQFLIFKYIYV